MSNIAQKIYKFESINKINKSNKSKQKKKSEVLPNKPKPLPEWNACINDVDKYKLSSAEIVKMIFIKMK